MATIAQQTISISIARLVKSTDREQSVLSDEQLMSLIENLPSVVEQLLDDDKLVVEINLDNS